MANCCSSSNEHQIFPNKHTCPINGKSYSSVTSTTILHQINEPWKWNNKEQGYYFCHDQNCEVVYFGEDDSVIMKDSLRLEIGVKETNPNALICYCFGVSKAESLLPGVKEFILKSTKDKKCACATKNPSGRCCLKDFQ